jgi:hypothetical protein
MLRRDWSSDVCSSDLAHRGNVRRLVRGEEHRFGRRARPAGGSDGSKGFNA